MTQNHTCLVRYTKPYVTQETSAEYLLNKINMYPMLIPLIFFVYLCVCIYPINSEL